jgi:endogenous inhibitor of DNA gyrase (YacG/DUF329 family)
MTLPCSNCSTPLGWFFIAAFDRQFCTVKCVLAALSAPATEATK